jgi:Fur family peroxide stress response transcriptional regulator
MIRIKARETKLEGFVARCREAGLPLTTQRLAIFRCLAASDRHPSAEEVFGAVRRELPTLSLATVYRNLERLARIDAVRRISRFGPRARWDANLEPHHHLLCTACGSVTDVVEPRLDAAARPAIAVAARHGFVAAGHAVEIFGRCAVCEGARPG